ncbi:MAG: sigma-70 family RNA polymerase sigma factor [Bacteroidota bacterium]
MIPSPHSEQDVIARILAGGHRDYAILVNRYKDRAFTLAFRLVEDREAAEELVQDAFVRAYRSLDRFRGEASFGTWLYRIVYNLCMSRISREGKRVLTVEISDELDASADSAGERNPTPLEQIEEEELQHRIGEEIARLPAQMRTAVLLFYVEGLSYSAMASVMQIPIGTVKTLLFRGRSRLRERIKGRCDKEVNVT